MLNGMKKWKALKLTFVLGAVLVAALLIAADHIDAPGVTSGSGGSVGSDITDVYAFENGSNMVFVINTQGLLSPAATASATFDPEVMLEINIDNSATKDNVEDLVIQATFEGGRVKVYGPVAPAKTGLTSNLSTGAAAVEANITTGSTPVIGEANGMKVFAGPRDDPFFFDLVRFKDILAGSQPGFRNPGVDAFAGTNVLSLVVEVPKSRLGTGDVNIWATSNRKM
jgi:hypothetical protein